MFSETDKIFSNTGNLSIWLSVFLVILSLSGLVTVYSIIKNKSIENENIDKLVEIGKWFVASVAISLSTAIVSDGFREREQDIKEMEVFDKYVSIILEANGIEKRKLLCDYFSIVSPDGAIKKSWIAYKIEVDKSYDDYKNINDELIKIEKKEFVGTATPAEMERKLQLEKEKEFNNQSLISKSNKNNVIPRVYIHISSESQREKMKSFQEKLESMGYKVPGIENMEGKANIPLKMHVRYFNDEDESHAEDVVSKLKELNFDNVYKDRVHLPARIGHLEVWLPKN